jgi:uncharacterized protein (DUF4415 family)
MKEKSTKKPAVRYSLDPSKPPELSADERRALDALGDRDIDTSDIPNQAGKEGWYSPVARAEESKAQVTLRIDSAVLAYFRDQGPGYQTRINAVLKQYMNAHLAPR